MRFYLSIDWFWFQLNYRKPCYMVLCSKMAIICLLKFSQLWQVFENNIQRLVTFSIWTSIPSHYKTSDHDIFSPNFMSASFALNFWSNKIIDVDIILSILLYLVPSVNFCYLGQYYQKIYGNFFAWSVQTVVETILQVFTFMFVHNVY